MGFSTVGLLGSRVTIPFVAPPPPPRPGTPYTAGPIVVPSVIAPAAPPPSTVAAIAAVQTQTVAAEAKKAVAGPAIVAGNVAAARATSATIAAAVRTVPTYAEQAKQAATAVVTSPAQRAEVARIVDQAQATLATFQPSRVSESGVVVTAKSPAPVGNSAFGYLEPSNPVVPKLIAQKAVVPVSAGPAGVAPGGAANAEGPSGLVVLALAAALLFFVKV